MTSPRPGYVDVGPFEPHLSRIATLHGLVRVAVETAYMLGSSGGSHDGGMLVTEPGHRSIGWPPHEAGSPGRGEMAAIVPRRALCLWMRALGPSSYYEWVGDEWSALLDEAERDIWLWIDEARDEADVDVWAARLQWFEPPGFGCAHQWGEVAMSSRGVRHRECSACGARRSAE